MSSPNPTIANTPPSNIKPQIHHLNIDSSWLFQVPRRISSNPSDSSQPPRKYFNILIDPWLSGPQTDIGPWLSKQWFRKGEEAAYDSIAKVEALLADAEGLDPDHDVERGRQSLIDAVVICHEFTDHCHEATLKQLPPSVPIFANPNPAALIASWRYFDVIHVVQPVGGSVHDQPAEKVTGVTRTAGKATCSLQSAHLPEGFDIRYLSGAYKGKNIGLPFHVAIVIAFPCESTPQMQKLLIYTPHGIPKAALTPLLAMKDARPPLLCLLHGRNEFHILNYIIVNLGARSALDVVEVLRPGYWFGTHDPTKEGVGLVAGFLTKTVLDVGRVRRERGDAGGHGGRKEHCAVFREVGNGEAVVLT